jgi:hypothetical protein
VSDDFIQGAVRFEFVDDRVDPGQHFRIVLGNDDAASSWEYSSGRTVRSGFPAAARRAVV